jgi:hypothetical protein
LPFPLGSVVKYRYHRQGSFLAQEHLSDGRPVRYRLYGVEGPGIVEDSSAGGQTRSTSAPAGVSAARYSMPPPGSPFPI